MSPASRSSADDGHILITGTGRAGTTLLVKYFTALGFDTGYDSQTATSTNPLANAGLEHSIARLREQGRIPYVAKSPFYTQALGGALDADEIRVKACIIPMRDLYEAAESRRAVSRRAAEAGLNPRKHPGGVAFGATDKPMSLERRLAVQFYGLVHALVRHDVPVFFLRFPDFARGEQDLHSALRPLLEEHGVTPAESERALAAVVDPSLIHSFDRPGGDASDA